MKRDLKAEGLNRYRVSLGFSCGIVYNGFAWAEGWVQAIAMCLTDARIGSTNPMPEGELIAQSAIRAN